MLSFFYIFTRKCWCLIPTFNSAILAHLDNINKSPLQYLQYQHLQHGLRALRVVLHTWKLHFPYLQSLLLPLHQHSIKSSSSLLLRTTALLYEDPANLLRELEELKRKEAMETGIEVLKFQIGQQWRLGLSILGKMSDLRRHTLLLHAGNAKRCVLRWLSKLTATSSCFKRRVTDNTTLKRFRN